MNGCESWVIRKADRRRMDAFELWCWRRMLRIPWTAKITNATVLARIKPEVSLVGKITRLRLSYFGHVMRSESLEKSMMIGIVSGVRRRGRQRMSWLDMVQMDTGMRVDKLREKVLDREAWRETIYRIAESRIRLTR